MNETENAPTLTVPSRRDLAILTCTVEGGMIALAVVLGALFGPGLWLNAAPGIPPILTGILAGLGLLILAVALVDSSLGRGTRLRQDMDALSGMFRHARPVDLIWISLLAGIGEEAFFRGFLLHQGTVWLSLPYAVVLTSLLFGLMHAISFSYIVFTTLIGVAMCGLFLWSGNLVVPIAAHAAYDLAALIYMKYFRTILAEKSQ